MNILMVLAKFLTLWAAIAMTYEVFWYCYCVKKIIYKQVILAAGLCTAFVWLMGWLG